MIRVLIFVFALFAFSAEGAAPSLSCSYSTTGGSTSPAPLGVVVDCSATTDADTTKPFHDLLFRHTFGDPGSGTWSYGANTNQSKNVAIGPIAAHVYETPGTYTITTTVTDGTNIARTTQSITVADPDTVYTGTATVCIANAVATPGEGGCPEGAATPAGTTDFDAAVLSHLASTKRLLFKRGDTFAAGTTRNITTAGPWTIGAYGSGAAPIVNLAATVKALQFTSTAVTNGRVMDLHCVGTGAAGTDSCIGLTASASKLTILRVTSESTGSSGFNLSSGTTSGITDSIVQDSVVSLNYSGVGIFVRMWTSALLGNSSGPVADDEHAIRISRIQRSVIAHNTASDPAATKSVMTIRVDPHVTTAEDSFYYVVSDNKWVQGTRSGSIFKIEPNSGDGRHYDAIVERNWCVGEAYVNGGTCMIIDGVRITVRNNLLNLDGMLSTRSGIDVTQILGTEPVPDDVNIYNNTIYSSATATTRGIWITEAAVVNTIIKNNLCWLDNGTACIVDSGTDTVTATNSSTAQATGTDPSFDTPLTSPIGFRIGTGSYAATGGTAIFPASNSDFFDCDDITANERIGAFIPRVRAGCRSGAGP